MASKVVIFGDSYANSEPVDWSWSNALKDHYVVANYAYAGSSDVYSRIQLFDYLQSNKYSKDDVILFFATSLWRMNLLNVFKNITTQSTYMSHAYIELGKFTKNAESTLEGNDINLIKSDPEFFDKYHEYLRGDTDNLYKQRLLNAKLLKGLPNFTVYYDTFYKTHEEVYKDQISPDGSLIRQTEIFERTMLQDDELFLYVKGELAYECGKHPKHRMSVENKIHNHLNRKQNDLFLEQVLRTIESKRNKFNEQEIFNLF